MKQISVEVMKDIVEYASTHSLRESEIYAKEKHGLDVSYSTIQRWKTHLDELKETASNKSDITLDISKYNCSRCGNDANAFILLPVCNFCKGLFHPKLKHPVPNERPRVIVRRVE